jgi:hypothetical protein
VNDHRFFCTQCGVGVACGDDGCCTSCGCDVCGMDQVQAHLSRAGYALIKRCPAHDLMCHDARCAIRDKA